jgi:hypothetical protein
MPETFHSDGREGQSMSAKIKILRAEIEANPADKKKWGDLAAELKLLGLKVGAWHDELFPPASPTSKRRGREAFTHQFMDAVCYIISSAQTGRVDDFFQDEIVAACKNADADFFRMMADAAEHVKSMPTSRSVHAAHVIALRKAAIKTMEMGMQPTKSELKKIVAKNLGNASFNNDQAWVEAFKDAGIAKIKARLPAKKAAKVKEKKR